MTRGWFLHRHEWEYLQQMILHYVPDNTKLIEISTSPLSTKRFLKRYLYGSYVIPVPAWIKYPISKSQGH